MGINTGKKIIIIVIAGLYRFGSFKSVKVLIIIQLKKSMLYKNLQYLGSGSLQLYSEFNKGTYLTGVVYTFCFILL